MNKTIILSVVFVVLAVVIIWGGAWYVGQMQTAQSQQDALSAQVEAQQAAASQSQLMQNLKIEDVTVGTGAVAQAGDNVTVQYTGTLDDGSKFDSSYDHGQAFTFPLGAGKVIKGWDLGVVGMRVGGKRNLTIPPELGYGGNGFPPVIPPNATLHFVIELVAVSTSSAQ
jgi:FKBP-type peptidyl-prolyl cis-trans isomerase